MKRKKTWFFVGAVLCLLVAAWGYYLYHKPRAGVASARADAVLKAEDLYAAFLKNEQAATTQYQDKVVEVSGTITDLEEDATGLRSVLLSAGSQPGGVNCSMVAGEGKKNKLEKGSSVRIKGRCSGFLMDVNLTDAVIVP
jgi:hypothetical protein